MTEYQKKFTIRQRCGHCGNCAPMEIVGEYSGVKRHDDYPLSDMSWQAGMVYQLLLCPACECISLRSYFWNDAAMEPPDISYELLYPGPSGCPPGVPQDIACAYESAKKVRRIDANAYGVLLGRLLELVCHDRDAQGESLNSKLEDLASRGEFPGKLMKVANGLRNLRNIGAHASLGELTFAELPILDSLCRAVLEYVYSAPFLANQAEESLRKVRRTFEKNSSSTDESESEI